VHHATVGAIGPAFKSSLLINAIGMDDVSRGDLSQRKNRRKIKT
jgi:hypothetical protein